MAPSKSTANHNNTNTRLLLKGYLPVRVHFPASPADDAEQDADATATTFFYVKEHQHKGSSAENDSTQQQQQQQPTLFIANAPSYPPIDTATMLQTLLGPLGKIKRVTVVPHPRATTTAKATTFSAAQRQAWYFDDIQTHRFAHVVFETHKDLRKCFKALQRIMSSSSDGCLTVDAVERQTLADAVRRKVNQKRQQDNDNGSDNESDSDDDDNNVQNLSGFQSIWHSYRRHEKRHQQREALLEECNAAMQAYEDAEQARLRAISTEPDDDGFVTVTHSTQPAVASELEENGNSHRPHSKGRSRKRKKGPGAAELDDFYRFQTKAKRKEDVQDLRQRFQQDLQRIQKIKDSQGGFKPFG